MENHLKKMPSPLLSLVPILVLVALLFVTIRTFGSDALSGGSQVVLLTTTAVASLLAMIFCKVKWRDIEEAICKNILGVATAIIILLLIGALSGSWMISGIVPTLIYYGMQIIHPSFFLASCCVICAVVSVMTGSSWTTIATIGIALMGIGEAQGFATGWVAGAIISGAYFGDKISPLSDTTVLASSVTHTPLFSHIRYMMLTTIPSMVITLIIFTIAGFTHTSNASGQIAEFAASLNESFNISLWLLIVPVVTGIINAKKVQSLITMFISTAMAGVLAIFFQPHLLQEVAGASVADASSLFKGLFMTFYGSTQIDTGNEALNSLVATRGMAGMMNTIWLIICAMCFGGVMTGSGMLRSLPELFLRFVRRSFSAVASTVGAGIFFNLCTADQYISLILSGRLFKDLYAERGFEERLLSRSVEDSATVCSVLVPWNSCGMTQATVLGVSTFVYLPYCIFNIVSPLMSLLVAALGWGIAPPAAPAAAPDRAQQAQ